MLSTDEIGKHNLEGSGPTVLKLDYQAFNESFD